MKKVLAIAVMLLVTATAVNAQIKFGVKAGANITEMSLSSDIVSAKNRTGFYIGPTVKFTLPIVGLGMDLSALYDQREAEVECTSDNTTYSETIKNKTLAIPLNVRYNLLGLGDKANIFIYAGPQIAFNLGSGSDYKGWTMRSSDFSGNIGLGVTVLDHFQINANYNVALGKTGDANAADLINAMNVQGQITNAVINGGLKDATSSTKSHSWQIGVAYFF